MDNAWLDRGLDLWYGVERIGDLGASAPLRDLVTAPRLLGWIDRIRRQYAPRPTHVRPRDAPCRRHRGGLASARSQRSLKPTLGIYGYQDQRDLEGAMEAFAEKREAEAHAASRGNDSFPRPD